MRRLLVSLLAVAAVGADFPAPADLPVRPGLPDPLTMLDGSKVTTREQWFKARRPELKELFLHYMYGYAPPPPAKVEAKVERTEPKALGGKAVLKEITLSFGPPDAPKIHLLLVTPSDRKGPFPTFVGMNFRGSYTLLEDPAVRLPKEWMLARLPGTVNHRATEVGRGTQIETWALDQSVSRGYAVATFYCGDVEPDKNDYAESVHAAYFKKGQTRPGPHEWGTIAAWAWGISRAVDYLVTNPDIDKDRIAVVGHSRLGKTALLAAVLDERIALAVPDKAGCGGTGPSRTMNPKSETVKAINNSFPHWFNDTFKAFNEQPEKLPFDQHCLIAMMAPRPVLLSNAAEDQWADPPGQFEMLKAAEPVYKLLGAGGLDAKEFPPENKLIDSKLGYYIRPGKHLFTRSDWAIYLDFADRHFGRK